MTDSRPDVAEVFRTYGSAYREAYPTSLQQRKVLRDLVACRTSALGSCLRQCDHCGHQEISYQSCRNRHCPKCLGHHRHKWLQAREQDLLPVPHFHIVFTLPEPLRPLLFHNQRFLYGLLFASVSTTLLTLARDPRHLGAQIGFLAVLHTWAKNLLYHPHIHCVVPGGGLSLDLHQWVASRPGFFLPVRVLSTFFKKNFLCRLRHAFTREQLWLGGHLQDLSHPDRFKDFCRRLDQTDWNVYCKPPFGGPQQVLRYLAAYTHRVALSNQRILSIQNHQVQLRLRPSKNNSKPFLTLNALEFIRRFLLHVLPPGLMRIRYYGLLANCCRQKKLPPSRHLLPSNSLPKKTSSLPSSATTPDSRPCPCCGCGRLILISTFSSLTSIQPRCHSP